MPYRIRTLLIVLPAALFFGWAGVEIWRHWEVVQLGKARRLPPTMYGEHAGQAVALICVGLIWILNAGQESAIGPAAHLVSPMVRYRLRTLLILLAVLPPLIGAAWWGYLDYRQRQEDALWSQFEIGGGCLPMVLADDESP